MEITDIRIALRDEENLKAFVSITLDGCFVVKGLKVIRGNKGLFVAMPSRRRSDNTHVDICHPIDRKTREWMEAQILRAYDTETDSQLEPVEARRY